MSSLAIKRAILSRLLLLFLLPSVIHATGSDGICSKEIDVIVLLDCEASISTLDFKYDVRPFLGTLAENFDISPTAAQMGLVVFDTTARTMFCLDKHATSSSLRQEFLGIPSLFGTGTNVAAGLAEARTSLLGKDCGSRAGSSKVVILITDGIPDLDVDETVPTAKNLRAEGVVIIGVAVGSDVSPDIMNGITGGPEFVISIMGFIDLATCVPDLTKLACNPPITKQADKTTTTTVPTTTTHSTTTTPSTTTSTTTTPTTSTTTKSTTTTTPSTTTTTSTTTTKSSTTTTRHKTTSTTTETPLEIHEADVKIPDTTKKAMKSQFDHSMEFAGKFDKDRQTCCCGVVGKCKHGSCPDKSSRCCATVAYDDAQDACCDGVITHGLPEEGSNCCGPVAYDPRTATCCEGTVKPAQKGEHRCCGPNPYNPNTHLCCKGKISAGQPHWQCCGEESYDYESEVCCAGMVSQQTGGTLCCGTKAYDPEQHSCCSGKLVHSPVRALGKSTAECCSTEGRGNSAKAVSWSPGSQTCCCGKVLDGATGASDGCCDTKRYDRTTQLCCDDNIITADPAHNRCCGKEAYNVEKQTCCDGNIVRGVGQCCGEHEVIDPSCELCCNGKRVHGSACSTCCVDKRNGQVKGFCPKFELCCEGSVRDGGPMRRCCGRRSYNTQREMCCDGHVVSRVDLRRRGVCLKHNPTKPNRCVCRPRKKMRHP